MLNSSYSSPAAHCPQCPAFTSHPLSATTNMPLTTTTTLRSCLMKEPGLKTAFQNIIKISVFWYATLCRWIYKKIYIYNKVSNKFVQKLFLTQKHFQINFKFFQKLGKISESIWNYFQMFGKNFKPIRKFFQTRKNFQTYSTKFKIFQIFSKLIRNFFQML